MRISRPRRHGAIAMHKSFVVAGARIVLWRGQARRVEDSRRINQFHRDAGPAVVLP